MCVNSLSLSLISNPHTSDGELTVGSGAKDRTELGVSLPRERQSLGKVQPDQLPTKTKINTLHMDITKPQVCTICYEQYPGCSGYPHTVRTVGEHQYPKNEYLLGLPEPTKMLGAETSICDLSVGRQGQKYPGACCAHCLAD